VGHGTGAAAAARPHATARGSRRLLGLLAVASVPAAAVGLLARDVISAAFEQPLAIAAFLVVTAVLLWSPSVAAALGTVEHAADDLARHRGGARRAAVVARVGIGCRAGARDLPRHLALGRDDRGGHGARLSRGAAARLSFLMLLPITVGAALVTLPDLATHEPGTLPFGPVEIALGVAVSAVSGYLAIRFLIALVARRSLLIFARYVLVLAAVLVVVTLVRG
jgi:undecaprenyl-diphosphatase